MPEIRCVDCGTSYPYEGITHICPRCQGVFDFDSPPEFLENKIDCSASGMWKFAHSFSPGNLLPVISLGEGGTPFIWDDAGKKEVGYKLESLNPTGSYKDRGSAVLVSHLVRRGIKTAVEDSSGNAGASFAAYCSRAGIKARVFVPESAAGPKRRQIEQYGAELIRVPGPRSEAAKAVLSEVAAGAAYGSHAFLPFGIPGIATIAYELLEQTGGAIGTVIAPAGHGALLLGIMRGFTALQNAGKIKQLPYFVGVQAENCSPIALGFSGGANSMTTVVEGNTIAEGVRVSKPVRAKAILKEIQPDKGRIVAIPEPDILPACDQLAVKGIYAEPTSALVWAAFQELKKELPLPIILIISGNGLKYYPISK